MENKYLEMPWSIEDTIENLKEVKKFMQMRCKKMNLDDKGETDAKEVAFDFDRAIEALKKQIPKKPLFGTVHNDTTYHCSNCKNFIGFYDTRIYEYCHNCGQKLDWQTRH